jgi:8-oxo-dGTP pyrophosphatase MutT (NUDIX family)
MTLFERLVGAVNLDPPSELLTGDIADDAGGAETKAAAVLVAITERAEPGVILTIRRPELRRHAGQIAFPGGRLDPGEDAPTAALREAEEEIGLPPEAVRIAGRLDRYRTITGYDVTPVLAAIDRDLPLTPHEAEVADIFEAPLSHLLDASNHVRRSVLFEGTERHYYEILWEGRRIWGATAAMIVNLSKRMSWA